MSMHMYAYAYVYTYMHTSRQPELLRVFPQHPTPCFYDLSFLEDKDGLDNWQLEGKGMDLRCLHVNAIPSATWSR